MKDLFPYGIKKYWNNISTYVVETSIIIDYMILFRSV